MGQPAFEWQVGKWSDGQTRKLADYRGRIVFLDFWSTQDGQSVSSLPVLNRLKERYEPLGVVFLSIHAPGGDERAINRVLLANQSKLVYAIDQTPVGQTDGDRGVTADLYGFRGFLPVFLIDREGKIAMREGDPGLGPKILAIIKEVGIAAGAKRITHEQSNALIEKLLTGEIERLLQAPGRGPNRP